MNLSAADYLTQARLHQKNPLIREDVHEIDRATKWLEDELSVGPAPSEKIQREAKQVDISYGTLRRAFKILECKVRKRKTRWFWSLPDLSESEYEEGHNERTGVPDVALCEMSQETVSNWQEVPDVVEIPGEFAMTNEMVLVS